MLVLLRELPGILQAPTSLYRHLPMLDPIKNTLWAAADKLRGNMDARECKQLLLAPSEAKAIAPALV